MRDPMSLASMGRTVHHLVMRRLFPVLILLAGCPGSSTGGPASTEGLFGFWRPTDGEQTVFAFASASDAEELFNLSGNQLAPQTEPVAAVYELDELKQLTTYQASATELTQTVLADVGSPPGTKFSTRIYEFERGVKLRLESKAKPPSREWAHFDFCPRSQNYGWGALQVTACPNPLTTGGSMAYDAQGRLFVFTGSGLSPGSGCPPAPAFLEVSRGCGVTQYEAPNARVSSTRAHADGVLRTAYLSLDNTLRVRERAPGAKVFTEATLQTALSTTTLILLDHRTPLLVTGASSMSGPLVFRREADAWAPSPLPRKAGGAVVGPIVHAVVDAQQRLWLLAGGELLREGPGGFETQPAPVGTPTSLYVEPEGVPHVLTNTTRGLEYTVLAGTTWERHVVDSAGTGVIVTHGARPLRVLTTASAFRTPSGEVTPWRHPALISVHDDGHLESELTGGVFNFMPAINTTFAAVGPRGEVAASLTGEQVLTRSPRGRLFPAAKQLDLVIEGPDVVVRSDDGRIRCEKSCTVDATLGERIAFRVEPRPGVAVTLASCDTPRRTKEAPCFFSVVPPMNASTAERNAFFTVKSRRTPLASAVTAANAQGLATTFGLQGDSLAVGVLFTGTANEYLLDDVAIPVTGTFESLGLVVLNRTTKRSTFVPLPRGVGVESIQPDGRGGAWAVLSISNQVVRIGTTSLGASQTTSFVVIHLTDTGLVDGNVTLVSFPRNAPLAVIGADLAPDGTAALVINHTGPLTTLGVPENGALVRVTADGTRTLHGFMHGSAPTGKVVAASATRVAFTLSSPMPATSVITWSDGRWDRTSLPGATAHALSQDASSTVVAFSSVGDVVLPGRTLSGERHVAGFGPTLELTGAFSLPAAPAQPWSWAVGLVPQGVGFITNGELRWLSPAFTPLGPALPLPTTATRVSGVPGLAAASVGGAMWLLAPPDLDFGEVVGRVAIAELRVF